MSYILDALKKAAEQRDRHVPVLKRLLGPAPTPRSVWARSPAAPPPATPAQPPTSPSLAGLRLEALIYSDVPEKRMIFVNGRKYVEGDTIEGRLRVEEIQEDSVALSDDGRRMTLQIAR